MAACHKLAGRLPGRALTCCWLTGMHQMQSAMMMGQKTVPHREYSESQIWQGNVLRNMHARRQLGKDSMNILKGSPKDDRLPPLQQHWPLHPTPWFVSGLAQPGTSAYRKLQARLTDSAVAHFWQVAGYLYGELQPNPPAYLRQHLTAIGKLVPNFDPEKVLQV